ncbi:MAG: preprotein translocase subunit SecE [Elusimicrobia bacterium]|nr:preprotein translocase subunit SecE [Elusimicrobiota bacterium]
MSKAIQFFKDAYFELTKVTWLGKKEVVATTIVVVVFVIILAIFVSFVDMILSSILGIILNLR